MQSRSLGAARWQNAYITPDDKQRELYRVRLSDQYRPPIPTGSLTIPVFIQEAIGRNVIKVIKGYNAASPLSYIIIPNNTLWELPFSRLNLIGWLKCCDDASYGKPLAASNSEKRSRSSPRTNVSQIIARSIYFIVCSVFDHRWVPGNRAIVSNRMFYAWSHLSSLIGVSLLKHYKESK